MWETIWLTLKLAGVTTAVLLVVGTPIAWWLARSGAWWKEAVATVVALPLVLRTANGGGLRFGAQHSQSIENWAMAIAGLKVGAT